MCQSDPNTRVPTKTNAPVLDLGKFVGALKEKAANVPNLMLVPSILYHY